MAFGDGDAHDDRQGLGGGFANAATDGSSGQDIWPSGEKTVSSEG
jgi:hypothetical protein